MEYAFRFRYLVRHLEMEVSDHKANSNGYCCLYPHIDHKVLWAVGLKQTISILQNIDKIFPPIFLPFAQKNISFSHFHVSFEGKNLNSSLLLIVT